MIKNLPAIQETPIRFLGQEDPGEKGKATHSVIRKNEILPFVTTWMDLEGIMPSEITQRKTNII